MAEDTTADETTDEVQETEPEPEAVTPAVEDDGDSVVDLAQQPIVVDWIKYVSSLFAFLAVGLGLFTLLMDVVDPDTIGISEGGPDFADTIVSQLILLTPVLAITIAVFLGAFLGWKLETDDTTTFLAAGLSALVGLVVFWVLGTILGTVFSNFSLEFGDLLINSIVAGIAAAVTAIGGVWASRNLAPATLGSSSDITGESAATPADD
ncbi:hypothetical protein ACLI4U_14540 [Natrialbaceae archaeon A-CW2]|uniref:hypothetical protein n=1 Tax=Natronosalvus amylolyticus TaxID=2961994 RepID=UPI0020C9F4C6|nr:hypothetical protein [Natronosalvus amylolyticus]